MRLPVSRARFDLLTHNTERFHEIAKAADERARSWQALYESERIRSDRLVAQLLTMKQAGFQTATERQALPVQSPSRIDEIITEKAGANSALRRHLSRWAAQRQAMNVPEDEIADALVNWRDPDAEEVTDS